MPKIFLFALDGATWEVINPLLEKGELPTLRHFIEKGSKASLRSLPGYKSPSLWTSIATGKLPEETGISYFSNLFLEVPLVNLKCNITNNFFIKWPYLLGKQFSKDPKKPTQFGTLTKQMYIYTQEKLGQLLKKLRLGGNYLVTSTFRKEKAFWEIFNEAGKSCGIVGWLATWPPDKIRGCMVCPNACSLFMKTLTSENRKERKGTEPLTYPDYVIEELESFNRFDALSPERLDAIFRLKHLSDQERKDLCSNDYDPTNLLKFSRHMMHTDEFFLKAAEQVAHKFNPDILAVYLPGIDGFQHLFWRYHQPDQFLFSPPKNEELQKYGEVINNYYKHLDARLGALLQNEKNAVVIVASDHGIAAIPQKDFNPKSPRSGQHENSPDGILIIKGPMIKEGETIKEAHLLDLVPTLLYLSGLPVDERMPGRVLTEAITEEFLRENHLQKNRYEKRKVSETFYRPEEEQSEREVLKKLGYLKN